VSAPVGFVFVGWGGEGDAGWTRAICVRSLASGIAARFRGALGCFLGSSPGCLAELNVDDRFEVGDVLTSPSGRFQAHIEVR
jgi:hypothetical protein